MLPTIINSKDMMLLEQKDHITREQHYKLLEACERWYTSGKPTLHRRFIRDRNYMILLSMWNTAARVGDIASFMCEKIDTYSKQITFLVNKRSRKDEEKNIIKPYWHTVKLEDSFILAYHNYVKKWGITGYLFTSFKHRQLGMDEQKPISPRQIEAFVDAYALDCGLDVHPHMYRHGLAVEMLNNGVPIEIISKFLGHASIETTIKFYAKITPDVAWRFIQDKMRIN